MKIFIDMDGVLCNWIKTFNQVFKNVPMDYKTFLKHDSVYREGFIRAMHQKDKRYYRYFEPIHDVVAIIRQFMSCHPDEEYYILTSVSRINPMHIVTQKLGWLKEHFPDVPIQNFRYVHDSQEKALYADSDSVIIDDYGLVQRMFREAGGHAIDGISYESIKDGLEKLSKKIDLHKSKSVV